MSHISCVLSLAMNLYPIFPFHYRLSYVRIHLYVGTHRRMTRRIRDEPWQVSCPSNLKIVYNWYEYCMKYKKGVCIFYYLPRGSIWLILSVSYRTWSNLDCLIKTERICRDDRKEMTLDYLWKWHAYLRLRSVRR